ncbi:MAG TPA: VTT domain-containing protein [Gemmatimonadaceae bacterium]|nr:VTT domain-containing protein [Gemmatimonadaceae bacterium]
MLSRLIAALHRWAESGWAGAATATWELMQSSVVPGPSGVVFAPLAVADPPRAPRLALWGLAGSIAGGCIAYLIGAHAFDELGRTVLSAVGVSDARIVSSEKLFERHGWLLVFASTISPLSTKLTCIAAGAFGLPVVQFLPALLVGRALRFGILMILLRTAGDRLAERLARQPSGRESAPAE